MYIHMICMYGYVCTEYVPPPDPGGGAYVRSRTCQEIRYIFADVESGGKGKGFRFGEI